ncbi:MAG TPA: AAA family ATPase [Candidatus Flavonifractor merdigallinarum]|uniref:AAA family ATPase n=1 Tax=Candidatus Flavonifractor merdigallinarum TaxID=2838589 RepID=A0A9D1YAZ6_9FIRM|nr:AAA family ATPase [Candidatus Flavonifractor merdigallinarum]
MFLDTFRLPGEHWESDFLAGSPKARRTCYRSYYPFGVFPPRQLEQIECAPVTIFYGGNGSGKSTLLSLIAQVLGVERGAPFNHSAFFDDFAAACRATGEGAPAGSRLIASDDVFDFLLDLRCINDGVERRREELLEEYAQRRRSAYQLQSLEDLEELRKNNAAKSGTGSRFVRQAGMVDTPERSNGESAFLYFTEHIRENALYLLDEPENSMAVGYQLQLRQFLEDSVRFYRCQLLIATHSPFLLSLPGARVYDLDSRPVAVRAWTELENMRAYYTFFEAHSAQFESTG